MEGKMGRAKGDARGKEVEAKRKEIAELQRKIKDMIERRHVDKDGRTKKPRDQ